MNPFITRMSRTPRTSATTRTRTTRAGVWLAAAATAAASLLLAPAAAQAAPQSVQDDFNGDGYRDLAVGAPYADVNGKSGAGAVVILFGSATGVSFDSARRKVTTQSSPGVPGAFEEYDAFGAAIASADLDRDGYTDLLVGSDRETVGTRAGRGSVTVIWGGKGGLTASGDALPASSFTERAAFGENIAAGDFDNDGASDVSVAARDGATHYKGPFTRTGAPSSRQIDDRLGTTHNMIAGDLTGDGVPERIILAGSVDGDINGEVRVDHWNGTEFVRTHLPGADGLSGAVGDINGDGYADVAVSVSMEDLSGKTDAGAAVMLYGSASGLTTSGSHSVHQDTAGVPGAAEAGDRFGDSIRLLDLDKNGRAELSVGAAGENSYGMLTVLRSSASGITTSSPVSMKARTVGLAGDSWFGAVFGR